MQFQAIQVSSSFVLCGQESYMKNKLRILLVASLLSMSTCAQSFRVKLTGYHPVKSECDANPLITADGSHVDLRKLKKGKIRWCAVSRELLRHFPKDKPKRIWIEDYGVYEVRDVTHKRIKNTVDIMLHPADKQVIFRRGVRVRIL